MKRFSKLLIATSAFTIFLFACPEAFAGPFAKYRANNQNRVNNQVAVGTPSTIQIDLSQTSSSNLKQGLVCGPNNYAGPTPTLDTADKFLSALKLKSWRFGGIHEYGYGSDVYRFVVEDYRYKARFGADTVLALQDIFQGNHGKPMTVKSSCRPRDKSCFTSFEALQRAWHQEIHDFLIAKKNAEITYFDLLGEADLNSFVGVNIQQQYELFKDAYFLVRELRPDAKIVGPSNAGFKPKVYEGLVSYMVRDGIHLDAISWHDFGTDPSVVVAHAQTMRGIFQKYPAICQPKCPQLHVNEYEGEETMLIPGYAVGWLDNLEIARIDQANRACWGGDEGSPITYQSCWEGFSGFLTPDSLTPQPLYWVYKYYADLNGSRYGVNNVPARTSVISGNLGGGKIGILVGNYGNRQGGLSLQLANFKASTGDVTVYKLPNTGNRVMAMPNVDAIQNTSVPAQNATLTLSMSEFEDGAAYWIVVTPR